MRYDSRAVGATLVGAVLGGIAGYLFLTDHGRDLRRSIDPALEDLSRELEGFRTTILRAAGVANEGWRLMDETFSQVGGRERRVPDVHQSSPF